MAATFSDLGIELMATGENAGTWGDKTNTNLQIVEKAIAGYVENLLLVVQQQQLYQLQMEIQLNRHLLQDTQL